MPTAKFEADFTSFNTAVNTADANLRKFSDSSDKSERTLRLVEGTGKNVGNSFGQLSQGLGAADKTLQAMGVHIGPEIHALEELSQAAGKTAADIGLIGTASLTAAAALGGWEIGRMIAKFFDLDKTIGDATAKLLGFGDVAAETAAAKQDVLARATVNAGHAITDYNEAVQINIKHAKDAMQAAKDHAAAEKDTEKALKASTEAAHNEADAIQRLQKAHEDAIHAGADKLFGNDAVKAASDYVEEVGRIENIANLNADALEEMFQALTKGISAMVEQGQASSDLTAQLEQYRIAVVQAQQTHTQATITMETDEQRLARESAELAQAMKDNFVVIGQSAQEAAQKVTLSWNEAIEAARKGQGTLGGSFSSVPVGAPGSTTRYDDYGNPYGYIPGVNQPGHVSPPGGSGGSTNIFNFQDAYFDTPASQQRLAERVTTALGSRASSLGR